MRMNARFERGEAGPLLFEHHPLQPAAHGFVEKSAAAKRQRDEDTEPDGGGESAPVRAQRKYSERGKDGGAEQAAKDRQSHACREEQRPVPRRGQLSPPGRNPG